MRVTFGTIGTASSGNSNNRTPTLPGGWAADQLCVIFGWAYTAAGSWTVTEGWNKIVETSDATYGSLCVAWKKLIVGDSDPTISYSAAANSFYTNCFLIYGVDKITPVDIAISTQTYTLPASTPYTVSLSSVTPVSDNSLAIYFSGLKNDVVSSVSGWTENIDAGTAVGSDCMINVSSKQISAASAIGSVVITYASASAGISGSCTKIIFKPPVKSIIGNTLSVTKTVNNLSIETVKTMNNLGG